MCGVLGFVCLIVLNVFELAQCYWGILSQILHFAHLFRASRVFILKNETFCTINTWWTSNSSFLYTVEGGKAVSNFSKLVIHWANTHHHRPKCKQSLGLTFGVLKMVVAVDALFVQVNNVKRSVHVILFHCLQVQHFTLFDFNVILQKCAAWYKCTVQDLRDFFKKVFWFVLQECFVLQI